MKINVGFLEGEFAPQDADRTAAWELYIELLTRVATQYLPPEDGDEAAALKSVHAIFSLTREILRKNGAGCGEFAKIAIPVLNQVVRPFTAKWHRISLQDGFKDQAKCQEFREELAALQGVLVEYTKALAGIADVEDLTVLEEV